VRVLLLSLALVRCECAGKGKSADRIGDIDHVSPRLAMIRRRGLQIIVIGPLPHVKLAFVRKRFNLQAL
jgi:hypothetical protein